ncbi:hypothetical protein EIP86_006408 [Pleurotus ostreatoroseus]|nr:hypothetical protein EIP86_006408 [Pleurotus ostreatoroseus]
MSARRKEPSSSFQSKHKLNFDGWDVGRDGPLKLTYPATIGDGEMKIRETLLKAGVPLAPLPYDGDPLGLSFVLNTIDPETYTRTYSTTAFYLPNKERSNFSVLVSAHAHRVLTGKTEAGLISALGVEFEYQGRPYYVNAREDVILCAGSLRTPQILELSGIGRHEVLDRIGVPTKLDLPGLGQNVQEHMYLPLAFELKEDVDWPTLDLLRDPALFAEHAELHALGSGVFNSGMVSFTFLPLDMVAPPDRAAEIYAMGQDILQRMIDTGAPPSWIEQTRILVDRLKPGGTKRSPGCEIISYPGFLPGGQPNSPEPGKRYVSLLMALNHNFSRGTIHSASSDPAQEPEYDPNYFSEAIDLEVALEIVKYIRRLTKIAPLRDMLGLSI